MSSTPTKCLPSVEDYISKLEEKRDKQTQDSSAYRKWNRYVKRAQGQGVTAESIKAMLDADYIRIDEFIEQTGQGTMRGRTRFPKNLTTVEQYITELEKFKNRQRPKKSTYYYWGRLVKIAKEDGATVDSIEEAMKKAKEAKFASVKKKLGGGEDSGSAASPSTAAAVASSSKVMISGLPNPENYSFTVKPQTEGSIKQMKKKEVTLPPKKVKKDTARVIDLEAVTPDTCRRRRSVSTQVSVGVSSGGSSTKIGTPPQTSTKKATAAPTSKTQMKQPVPATNTTSHSRSHPQSHSRSSSISSTRQQHQVVASEGQRPNTPTKDMVSASASQNSPRKTSHTVSTPREQRLASPSPLNSPQKRKLSLSSEGESISNQSNQSNQYRCGTPSEDEWSYNMSLEEYTANFEKLKDEYIRSVSFYDPSRRQ